MTNRIALFTLTIGLSLVAVVRADENVREVQTKLSNEGIYFGEIDGLYSTDLSAALTRYQIRNGIPITGQLDEETSKALGAKPAVTTATAAPDQSSEIWRQLRKGERRTSASARTTLSTSNKPKPAAGIEIPPRAAPAATAANSSESAEPAAAPPATTGEFSTERLRDYVAAFVLAGLDKNVGAEAEFFADRVDYYDSGVLNREEIREDLKRYDLRWPERSFWLAGNITVEPQSDHRVRVTFPLEFKLRNGNKQSSGKVDKTLVLQPAGEDLQIVSVNERRSD